MGKFACVAVLVAAVLLGPAMVAEAASPRAWAVKTLGPRAVVMLKNAGNGISKFLWRNKGTVTGGVVLTAFALNPAPLVSAASTMAGKTLEAVASIGGPYLILAALVVAGVAAVYYAVRKVQWRRHMVPIVACLVLFIVICCCGVAVRADTISSVPMVEASAGLLNPGWLRIALDPDRKAHGDFTIADGQTFTLGVALDNNSTNLADGWLGNSLTKKGGGTLVLTAANGYTGQTTVSAGTLALSGAGSIADSEALDLQSGTTFDISGITAAGTGPCRRQGRVRHPPSRRRHFRQWFYDRQYFQQRLFQVDLSPGRKSWLGRSRL